MTSEKPEKLYHDHSKASKALEAAFKSIFGYCVNSGEPYVLVVKSKEGWIKYGTKELVKLIESQMSTIKEAGLVDKRNLHDQDFAIVQETLPAKIDPKDATKSLYKGLIPPLLPYPLHLLNDNQCRDYLLPEIRRDIAARTGKCEFRIQWSKECHKPSFWPDEFDWKKVKNPSGGDNSWCGVTFQEVMQLAIKNRLLQKGLDPENHVVQDR